MTSFINEDFLLQTDFAIRLYHDHAKSLPLIDYHCHLPPHDIASNRKFANLTRIWLEGDHYKWRAMRTLGIPEKYITGDASDEDKFRKWAYTVPFTVRNPLYHWTHLELTRYFDVKSLLAPGTADHVYQVCNEKLSSEEYSTQGLLQKMNVEVVCTTDDPVDTLEFHQVLSKSNFPVLILPAFRPDKAYAVENVSAFNNYLRQLEAATSKSIRTFADLLAALETRIEFFHSNGCRLSDHGLEQLYFPQKHSSYSVGELFNKLKDGKELTQPEAAYFKYCALTELAKIYQARGWTQQFHLGALRNTNDRMMRVLGPDTGFDSIGDFSQALPIARFLNQLDSTDQLAKTILYNLNPSDNEVMATMTGNFNDGSVKGKVQYGSAWWFLDQKDGMEKQLNAISNLGMLSCFVGMLTDSRSFMSYPRHEYFRRVLCNLIGNDVRNGELPADEKWLGKIVSDICYHNAAAYFGFSSINKKSYQHA